jgi:hypothetical protein
MLSFAEEVKAPGGGSCVRVARALIHIIISEVTVFLHILFVQI